MVIGHGRTQDAQGERGHEHRELGVSQVNAEGPKHAEDEHHLFFESIICKSIFSTHHLQSE